MTSQYDILTEQVEEAERFWKYFDTIDGRSWLFEATQWVHTCRIEERDNKTGIDFLIDYAYYKLYEKRIPANIIKNSFYIVFNDKSKQDEFNDFLNTIIIIRKRLN